MTKWTLEDLYKLDLKYAQEGLHFHQRPFHAAVDLLGSSFSIGVYENPEVDKIIKAYEALMPGGNANWPGAGIGFVASVDRVKKVTLSVVFGDDVTYPWQEMGFESYEEWWEWCRGQNEIARESHFSFADIYDFSTGVSELSTENTEALKLWRMAQSNLQDLANALPTVFSVDSLIQPICLVVELSIKGALLNTGLDPKILKSKYRHDLVGLAKKLKDAIPHRDDPLIELIVSKLPPYVESRYSPAGLNRLAVVKLALGAQFIAGSIMRRLSSTDLALEMEQDNELAPRPPLFTI